MIDQSNRAGKAVLHCTALNTSIQLIYQVNPNANCDNPVQPQSGDEVETYYALDYLV